MIAKEISKWHKLIESKRDRDEVNKAEKRYLNESMKTTSVITISRHWKCRIDGESCFASRWELWFMNRRIRLLIRPMPASPSPLAFAWKRQNHCQRSQSKFLQENFYEDSRKMFRVKGNRIRKKRSESFIFTTFSPIKLSNLSEPFYKATPP